MNNLNGVIIPMNKGPWNFVNRIIKSSMYIAVKLKNHI